MAGLLAFAEELERLDADVERALARVEELQREVARIRRDATSSAAFLAGLPARIAGYEAAEREAAEDRATATTELAAAEERLARAKGDDERLAAERDAQRARDRAAESERRELDARAGREQLEHDGIAHRDGARALAARAAELATEIRDAQPTELDLDGVAAWASQARGALLVERAALARRREDVVREASELVASVLGEPLTSTRVAGVRARLAQALGEGADGNL